MEEEEERDLSFDLVKLKQYHLPSLVLVSARRIV